MNYALAGFLVAVAAGATGVAIWAGPNPAIAAPAAALAVVAAGLLFLAAGVDRPPVAAPPRPPALPRDEYLFRYGFRSGPLGREEIVATLDRIERSGPNPQLPSRSSSEVASVVELPRADFREYVRRRVEDLEVRS